MSDFTILPGKTFDGIRRFEVRDDTNGNSVFVNNRLGWRIYLRDLKTEVGGEFDTRDKVQKAAIAYLKALRTVTEDES